MTPKNHKIAGCFGRPSTAVTKETCPDCRLLLFGKTQHCRHLYTAAQWCRKTAIVTVNHISISCRLQFLLGQPIPKCLGHSQRIFGTNTVNMTEYFMAGDNHHAVQEHKINMLQSTGLTSGNTAIAGPTYTFHPTNVIIVSTIGQSDYSSCESRDQSRSRGAGCRLLLLLLSRGDDGSKPYGYDFATTLDHLKKKQLWII
jgi:hypothetical protein